MSQSMTKPEKVKLIALRRMALFQPGEVDMICSSMMRSMRKALRLSGEAGVDLGGVNVKMEIKPHQKWGDRLKKIRSVSMDLAESGPEGSSSFRWSPDRYSSDLLKYDGWALTMGRLKTPLWMVDAVEVEFINLPEELRWVERCALETTSGQTASRATS